MLKDQDTQTAIMGLAPTEAGTRESEVEILQGGRGRPPPIPFKSGPLSFRLRIMISQINNHTENLRVYVPASEH